MPPLYIELHNFTILISTSKNYVDPCYEIFSFLQLISPSDVQNLLLSSSLLNILNIVSRYTETSVFHIPSPTHPFTHPPKSEQTCNLHISDPFLNIRNRTGCRSIVLYCIEFRILKQFIGFLHVAILSCILPTRHERRHRQEVTCPRRWCACHATPVFMFTATLFFFTWIFSHCTAAFYSEAGGNMFLRNVGTYLPNYTASSTRP